MIHLQSIHLRHLPDTQTFPFSLLLFRSLKELHFETPVTLLVGENGTGKSTLLEGLACAAEMVVVGSERTTNDMITQNGQFIIATHSAILMAFPGATILNFDGGGIQPAKYDELEHVRLMRDFLQDPQAFLHNL